MHLFAWNGSDSADRGVSSGVYFARLTIGVDLAQVETLLLIK